MTTPAAEPRLPGPILWLYDVPIAGLPLIEARLRQLFSQPVVSP